MTPPRAPAARFPLALAVALAACRPAAPPLPEVRVHATVSPAAAKALVGLAAARGVARMTLVDGGPAAAELAWLGDPSEAVEAAADLVPGAGPPQPGVADRWKDPAGRFVPFCARARVLVVAPKAVLAPRPEGLRDLADRRLAGRQALSPLSQGLGPATVAALALVHGEQGIRAFLDLVARNHPRIAASDDEVRVLVAGGAAAFGLTGSEEAAAGAVSAAALEVVYPDQRGSGTVILPTAVALTKAGAASEAARKLHAWMAGEEAEGLLAARVPGYLPLRAEVPVPLGVRPAGNLRSPPLDWDRLAEAKRRLAKVLEDWPSP
jgi:iron(III) transport system substrate-binding protein